MVGNYAGSAMVKVIIFIVYKRVIVYTSEV